MIDVGGSYRIVPVELASVGANLRRSRRDAEGRSARCGQVVQLKYVSAAEIRRVLEPISPREAFCRSTARATRSPCPGNSQEIANMLDAISVFDIDVMKGMSFALVPVKTSQPDAIVDDLRAVFASNSDGPMAGMVRFIPNRQLSAVLVVSPQPAYLTRAEEWVRRFDARAAGTEKQFYTYPVQNRRAQELVDVLQSVFANETGGSRGAASPRNVAPQLREASAQSSTPLTGSFQHNGMGGGASAAADAGGGMEWAGIAPEGRAGRASRTGLQPGSGAGGLPTRERLRAARRGPDPAASRASGSPSTGKNAILIRLAADYKRVRASRSLDVMPTRS